MARATGCAATSTSRGSRHAPRDCGSPRSARVTTAWSSTSTVARGSAGPLRELPMLADAVPGKRVSVSVTDRRRLHRARWPPRAVPRGLRRDALLESLTSSAIGSADHSSPAATVPRQRRSDSASSHVPAGSVSRVSGAGGPSRFTTASIPRRDGTLQALRMRAGRWRPARSDRGTARAGDGAGRARGGRPQLRGGEPVEIAHGLSRSSRSKRARVGDSRPAGGCRDRRGSRRRARSPDRSRGRRARRA